MINLSLFNKINTTTWEIPKSYQSTMRVPARIIATQKLLDGMEDGVLDQISNVASLPGIVDYALAMPDAHWGYGAPIGAVFAIDPSQNGIISPGAIGFDINCGMRLIRTNLTSKQVQPRIKNLVDTLFQAVPAGVGASGAIPELTSKEINQVMINGMQWCIDNGYGWEEDRQHAEEYGQIKGANPENVSPRTIKRGLEQLGTLGSGNHYLEIQVLKKENIFDQNLAEKFGLFPDQVTVMIHCGSRGVGHQVATDYLRRFEKTMSKYSLRVQDKQLSCAPFNSQEGQNYYGAMAAAANFGFANRQLIMHLTRQVFAKIFQADARKNLGMELIYDVAHNIAKLETYQGKQLLVHRKGATRAFGPNHLELPKAYQETGQPVILGGSMETGSYLLVGTKEAEEKTFGSTAHGSGRIMSRSQAKKQIRGDILRKEMEDHGIYVRSSNMAGLAEEAGAAYKDINEVIRAVSLAKISYPVAAFTPIGNIKG